MFLEWLPAPTVAFSATKLQIYCYNAAPKQHICCYKAALKQLFCCSHPCSKTLETASTPCEWHSPAMANIPHLFLCYTHSTEWALNHNIRKVIWHFSINKVFSNFSLTIWCWNWSKVIEQMASLTYNQCAPGIVGQCLFLWGHVANVFCTLKKMTSKQIFFKVGFVEVKVFLTLLITLHRSKWCRFFLY